MTPVIANSRLFGYIGILGSPLGSQTRCIASFAAPTAAAPARWTIFNRFPDDFQSIFERLPVIPTGFGYGYSRFGIRQIARPYGVGWGLEMRSRPDINAKTFIE